MSGSFSRQISVPQAFYQTGCYFSGMAGDNVANYSMAGDTIAYVPLIIQENVSVDRIGINVTSALSEGEARLGIRRFVNKALGELILDAGTVDCSTTGAKQIIINTTLPPGLYMGMLHNKVAGTSFSSYSQSGISGSIVGRSSIGTSFNAGFALDVPYGPFPTNPESGAPGVYKTFSPIIFLRIA